ncbi:hypothetical protein [Methylovirgula sp. 4M-Z18]|uniref:hypothetical protein n=1 Tax=Methylovirgula sp. 4M-Z18 TaxID=2293567 RepID=UPI000E2F3518|nr:hypothetical protein [Methylovirgula sp. 4M-Z18]RFB76680.1 hypothetical protein DYH55_19685 [Methylovirgula sp. 4M-Z18]
MLRDIFLKTFGGFALQYYLRHLLFGLIFPACAYFLFHPQDRTIGLYMFLTVTTLLYPYSRFVYESIMAYLLGSNVFFVSAFIVSIGKLFTMFFCWALSPVVAPFGLAYLYYYHSKQEHTTNSASSNSIEQG